MIIVDVFVCLVFKELFLRPEGDFFNISHTKNSVNNFFELFMG